MCTCPGLLIFEVIMTDYLNYNGKQLRADKAIITADNRSFRYGDGLFETMKMVNGKLQLATYHFERLFQGINLLEFEKPEDMSPGYFTLQILRLCKKNNH